MCGIVAILDRHEPRALDERVRAMTSTLEHRGPDDVGIWTDPDAGVALGHRRLAIRDPTPVGHQPMHSFDRRWVLAFNGELYDAEELAATLPARRLRGHSDTEVLLEAIASFGVRATLERVNGMFAFAVWDREDEELWLARDHLGIKPLHHARAGRALLCASELRAFRVHPRFPTELDVTAVTQMIDGRATATPRTVYRAASKLAPGSLLRARPGRAPGAPERWWDATAVAAAARADALDGGEDEVVDHVHALLRDSVHRQMVSDVPLGAFLSGGIDSSLVVAMMQEHGGGATRTFSIGFDDPRVDEGPHAEAVARHLGTDHTALRVGEAELLDVLPELVSHNDEPFGDPSQIPTLLVSRLARRSVTVALSGDGGDELFGGYLTYTHAERLWRMLRRVPFPVRRGLGELASGPRTDLLCRVAPRMLPRRDPEQVMSRIERGIGVLGGRTDTEVLERLCTGWPGTASPVRANGATPSMVDDDDGTWSFLERMMLADQRGYLPDTILTKVDRASMSVSLEVRVPLLDHRVFATAWRLGRAHRIRGQEQKWLLRRILDRYVPAAIVDRPKQGFTVPLADWLRGPLRPWAEDLLAPAALADVGFLDVDSVRGTWTQHLAGRPRQDGLWSLLMFLAWRTQWGR